MWTHTVLEIYQDIDTTEEGGYTTYCYPWPTEGEPANWINRGLVGYCQGRAEDLVGFIPLWKLLWWKIKRWLPER